MPIPLPSSCSPRRVPFYPGKLPEKNTICCDKSRGAYTLQPQGAQTPGKHFDATGRRNELIRGIPFLLCRRPFWTSPSPSLNCLWHYWQLHSFAVGQHAENGRSKKKKKKKNTNKTAATAFVGVSALSSAGSLVLWGNTSVVGGGSGLTAMLPTWLHKRLPSFQLPKHFGGPPGEVQHWSKHWKTKRNRWRN